MRTIHPFPVLKILLFVVLAIPTLTLSQDIKIILLGTGAPAPVMNRFGPSILVEAGGQKFLFDAGRGALQRLTQVKVRWKEVQGVFFTHLHSDHVVGFSDLWLTGWLVAPGRAVPLQVWGPEGTGTMMSHLEQAYQHDIRIRIEDERPSPNGIVIISKDINEGLVYDEGGVKVTAFEVDHGLVKPAFGYRIDFAQRSVILSGDTRVSDNLIRHAEGVDVLIHEVADSISLLEAGVPAERMKSILGRHTTPAQAGGVFSRTKPKLAVFSHIAPPAVREEYLIQQTRKTYSGPLEVGEDLMIIEVGTTIRVHKPTASSH